jgi:N-acetylneuraminic acid mutarotase
MYPSPLSTVTLTLGVLALAACGESTTPTQPETAVDPDPAASSVEQPQLMSSGLGSWTTKAPMPTPRSALAAAVIYNASHQPILYAIGGSNNTSLALRRVEAYNFATNTWTRKAALPSGRWVTDGASVINGKIYLVGGLNSSGGLTSSLYVYDPATNTWSSKASLPVKTTHGVSGVIEGKLYVLVSDCDGCETRYVRRLYRYDPSSNSWTRRADCPRQHVSPAGNVIGGKLYVASGNDENQVPQTWLDAYNPATNTWTAKAPLPAPRIAAPAAVLADNLYILGGKAGEDASMIAYDPATNTWADKAPMLAPWEAPAARTVTYRGVSHILKVGGFDGATSGSLEVYTP